MATLPKKSCEICGKEIKLDGYTISRKEWKNRKFCSRNCFAESKKGKKFSRERRKKLSEIRLKNPNRYWLGKKRPDLMNTNATKTMFKKGENRRLGKKLSIDQRKKLSLAHLKGKESIRSINKIIRGSPEYNEWRKDIYRKDDYSCQICGKRGFTLCADHIEMISKIIRENQIKSLDDALKCEELWSLENGRTLCQKCHILTLTYGSRAYG